MKLDENQYNEIKEKIAQEVIDSIMDKTAGEGEEAPLTEEQIKAIIEAKKAEAAEKAQADGNNIGNSQEEKAAALYEYSLNKIAYSQELYDDGQLQLNACIETLAEAGLYDNDGLNKQAAESSEEAIFFTNKVAEIYDDAMNKQAAAEECYAESVNDLNVAIEVLAQYGYNFE